MPPRKRSTDDAPPVRRLARRPLSWHPVPRPEPAPVPVDDQPADES